jgi:hypothetical protein
MRQVLVFNQRRLILLWFAAISNRLATILINTVQKQCKNQQKAG